MDADLCLQGYQTLFLVTSTVQLVGLVPKLVVCAIIAREARWRQRMAFGNAQHGDAATLDVDEGRASVDGSSNVGGGGLGKPLLGEGKKISS